MTEFRSWRCKVHPDERRCRTNGECAACWADAHAGESAPHFDRRPRPESVPRPTFRREAADA